MTGAPSFDRHAYGLTSTSAPDGKKTCSACSWSGTDTAVHLGAVRQAQRDAGRNTR